MALSEADTRAKLIDPAIYARGWPEDMICRETTLGAVEILGGKARRRAGGRTDYTLRMSDVKVGKKTPLTLKHFEDFAAKLATREDSEWSWTVDLSARRAKATADALPYRDTARARSQAADLLKDRLSELKKAKPRDEAAIPDADAKVGGLLKEARDATNKADDVEHAVYDLKAVNPHRKTDVDRRTPTELLDLIEAKGQEVAQALKALRELTAR